MPFCFACNKCSHTAPADHRVKCKGLPVGVSLGFNTFALHVRQEHARLPQLHSALRVLLAWPLVGECSAAQLVRSSSCTRRPWMQEQYC